MTLKCIAIDDEPLALTVISDYASRLPSIRLLHTYNNAVVAAEMLRKTPVDLIFMNINMPYINGTELERSLQEKPLVIFTTAYKKFAYKGFELEAVDYLLKPFSFDRFTKAVQKAENVYRQKKADDKKEDSGFLFIRSKSRFIKIALDDVDYIESLKDYIKIHLSNSRPVLTLMTLKSVLEKLPEAKFRRIHRSYIVAVNKVKFVQGKKLLLSAGTELPVSDSYINFIQDWMKE